MMKDIYTIERWADTSQVRWAGNSLTSRRYGVTDFHVNDPDGKPSRIGLLILDTRLQAIADAWEHLQALRQGGDVDSSVEEQHLADAIEAAITEENNGE